jgi:NTE family protein
MQPPESDESASAQGATASGTAVSDGPAVADGLAVAVDMGAGYGDGLGLGVSLGGGGVYFVAWQVSYLFELAARGVDLAGADRVVGTSAGSLVASVLEAGHLRRLHTELKVLAKLPRLVGALAPASGLAPSQERARDLFAFADDADPARIRHIGHAALAAATPPVGTMPRNIGVVLGSRRWPADGLQITCVDTFTAERCVVTRAAGVGIARAVAASSAIPGVFAPQPIGDRRCMDGGVSGSGTHVDLLAGARRAVVLGLTDGAGVDVGAMTVAPGSVRRELDALAGTGTEVMFKMPERVDLETLMDPAAVPDAVAMGRRQAAADADELRTFTA